MDRGKRIKIEKDGEKRKEKETKRWSGNVKLKHRCEEKVILCHF
jgi:hypothetical protein